MPGRKLGRTSEHRNAMLRGMVTLLLETDRSRRRLQELRKSALLLKR